ncbi:MAG TPA: AAA family ATPase [Pseudonocardia sp.]|nr:AAA family ATPase [Pseudonocardia sp.]
MTARAGLDRVRAGLERHGVQVEWHEKDGSWRGRCPIHQGKTRTSLSVRHHVPRGSDRGRAQLRCWAGCDERDVLALVGLTLADLYDDPPPPTPGATVAREHLYLGGDGSLVGVVRRTEPKSFRPATPSPAGWRARSSDDLKRLPYRLPAVVAAVASGGTVYIAEGERDADALAAVGVVATCNAGGAGKWTPDHAHWLKGADVVVCRDRDDAGRRHADTVIATLHGVAATVRLVEPVEGKDVTEHLAAGRSVDDLVPVDIHAEPVEHPTPARRLRVTRASAIRARRLTWLWDRRIVLGGLTLLAGREGLGKSTIAVDLTAQVTRGVLDGEFKGEPRSVVYVNSEDARDYTIVPRLAAAGADMDRVIFVDAVTPAPEGELVESPLVLPYDVERLADVVREHAAALVVLDAATSVIDSRLDGDRDRQMRQGLEGIARGIGEATGCGVLGIVHFGKRESADTGKLILGSIAWSQVARSVLAVALDEDSGHLIVSTTKTNLGAGAASLSVRIVSADVSTDEGATSVGRVEWLGETDRDARDLLGAGEVDERSELDEAKRWLTDYLDGHEGSAPAGEVLRDAKKDGIAERTLQRARKRTGVTSTKTPTAWIWALPNQDANSRNAVTSDDANTPTDVHVHEPWHLGALAPSGGEQPQVCKRCQRPSEHDLVLGRCRRCAYPAEDWESA